MIEVTTLNETHDPARQSWVDGADAEDGDFPLQNLPFGVFDDGNGPRGGVAIGDRIVDLRALIASGALAGVAAGAQHAAIAGSDTDLGLLLECEPADVSALRKVLSRLLSTDCPVADRPHAALVPMTAARLSMPLRPRSFSDAMLSIHHIARATQRRDGKATVPPAFRHLPIAYASRASTVQESGLPVHRPSGQWQDQDGSIRFGPSRALDFELELGVLIARGNPDRRPIPIDRARDHIFGLCLLNDWSARDIQRWESNPLGPFLGKSFATGISPWIVTMEALAPFALAPEARGAGDPALLPYLYDAEDQRTGAYAIALQAHLHSAAMRAAGLPEQRIVATSFTEVYWTMAQLIAHHSSNGCLIEAGDLIGSGTCSGRAATAAACFAEITGGSEPLPLSSGESRLWLEDGDDVIFRARAERDGFVPIGFGEYRARLLPPLPMH
ncbi:fumarylacetoacetase [Sphingomonas sp. CLY1604]|uniref:fumarylacetoacetase n=1 Tax=Sphingomonas sp. CLY1604 TaxID=3457786 RepID=UPI003FD809DB